ncbi:uncharacterized protein LOC135170782 [Diachasmimorpha longicaudata]|uniref:uncharacterized protein LOC135170782 n=1 Tax=Diachasmimorpha longicaudata TaxID=58733 RepID=UPI0030B8E294
MVNFCHRDLVAVVMRLQGKARAEDIVFCSAYFPHDSPTPPPTKELRDLVNHCRAKRLPLIIGCDANAQNVVGSRPTFVTSRCQCIIDITMCTRRLAGRCMDWRVDREDTHSDHRRIRFSIEGCAKLQQFTCAETQGPPTGTPLRGTCRKGSGQGNKVPWWSRELDRLRSQSRRLGNRAYRSKRGLDSVQKCAGGVQEAHQTIKGAHLENILVLSGVPAQRLGGITLTSGETITEPREVLQHLVCAHFPDSIMEHPAECPEADWMRSGSGDLDWELAARIVTLDRLRWAVDSFEMHKSPGPTGIYPALLRRGGPLLPRRLLPALRACLALGYVPSRWREVRVVFLLKPGKCSYDNAKAYRPISLCSFLLKTLERLVRQAH